MKASWTNILVLLGMLALGAIMLWLILHPWVLIVTIIVSPLFILFCFIIEAALHPKTNDPAVKPSAQSNCSNQPRARRPDTLTPLLIGVVVGWWLGGGPGPGGSDDC
jgi:hypothetical protein